MIFGEKDIKKLSIIILVAVLIILSFFLLRPVLLSVIGGLVLAYALMPVFRFFNKYIKNRNATASLVLLVLVIVIAIPLWFLVPLIVKQIFGVFSFSQTLDIQGFLKTLFPTSNPEFLTQVTLTFNNVVSKTTSLVLNSLVNFFLNIPKFLLHLFIVVFISFFAMRDSQKLIGFAKSLSPLSKNKEKIVVNHFKDITNSIIYGQIIVGIVQGLLAGLGFFVFGVDNAIVLTLLAVFLSVIPFIGPGLVWIPVVIYLFSTGNAGIAIGYLAYNVLIVSLADNFLRTYIVSRKTNLSQAIILIGMIGGLFVFGIMGLIIGPLLLAYLITLLESFKDKSIYTLFSDN